MGISLGDFMNTVHTLKDEGASDDDIKNLFKEAKKDGVDPGDIASAVKNGASLDEVKTSLHQKEHKAKEKSLSDISEG